MVLRENWKDSLSCDFIRAEGLNDECFRRYSTVIYLAH